MINKINVWLLAIRPKTLWVAIAPVVIGSSFAFHELKQDFSFFIASLTLFVALLIQIISNLVNDLYDYKKGADRLDRVGPLRVVQANLITELEMQRAIFFVFFSAIFFGFFLVLKGGFIILIIGLCSLLSAYFYTAGPYPLAYNGLGEVFVFIFFGILAVEGTYFLQCKYFSREIFFHSCSIGAIASSILVVNNLRDIDNDRRVFKKTLAVRFGKSFSRFEFSFFIFLAYLIPFFLLSKYIDLIILFLSFPFAIYLIFYVYINDGDKLNWLLENTAKLLIIYSVLLAVGFII